MKFDTVKRIVRIVGAASLVLVFQAGRLSAGEPPRAYELVFSTYFRGAGGDQLRDVLMDTQGNVYVAGQSNSIESPKTSNGPSSQVIKSIALIAKFNPAGGLAWSRVFGTGKEIYFYTVKVDKAGYVYVAGRMGPGFHTTPGAFQPTTQHVCGFMGKLKPDGSAWVWATYVGTGYAVRDMVMDDNGDLYGVLDYYTESKEVLPAAWFAHAFQKTPHGGGDHFGKCDAGVIKISADGKVLWATWIGGSNGNDWVASVGVGADHCPVILLHTWSKDMPTTPDAENSTPSGGWVGKLSADGSKLLFGTYIADAWPRTHNVTVDRRGNIFICSCTKSWPVTPGCFQAKFGGGEEDFGVAEFSPAGKLLAATYLGGNGHELNGPDKIALDSQDNIVIAGSSSSTDYPVTPGAFQPKNAGAAVGFPYEGVVSILSNDLSTLLYSTYIGGTSDDMARACFVAPDGTLSLAGVTASKDFPTKNAYQARYGGQLALGTVPNGGKSPVWGADGWLAKFKTSLGKGGN